MAITTFKNTFLSNFYPCKIIFETVEYPSVENAYQAAKCQNLADTKLFVSCSAISAKKLGRKVKIKKDWETQKIEIMHQLLIQKFTEPTLRQKLFETNPHELIEENYWGDTFWGRYNGEGLNILGQLLMDVRSDICPNCMGQIQTTFLTPPDQGFIRGCNKCSYIKYQDQILK